MTLRKARNEINKLKKDIGSDEEPTLQNFFRYCEKFYGHKVDYGELLFSTYWRNGEKRTSNRMLFLRLSEEYFTKIHNVSNPVKEGEHGLKWLYAVHWAENVYKGEPIYLDKVTKHPEFNKWFEDVWLDYKREFDKIDLSKYPIE